jgi:hypothetical protein
MAVTRRNKLAARYNQQLKQAKEAYKQRTGKEIARGFSKTPEAKRIEQNKQQAIYRYEKAKQAKEAEKLGELLPPPGQTGTKQIQDKRLGNIDVRVEADGMFWTVLGNDIGAGPAVAAFRENEMASGKKVRGIIQNDAEGSGNQYFSDTTFQMGLGALYRRANELQEKNSKYYFVSVVETETDPGQEEE